MDTDAKLQLLADNRLQPAEDRRIDLQPAKQPAPCGQLPSPSGRGGSLGIHPAVMPGGKTIALLKTMLTSACERDCYYCAFRAGRDMRRATFKPDEMAQTFQT